MMKSAAITIMLLALCPFMASATGTIDLEEYYRSLDEAIARTDAYVTQREDRISQLRSALEVSRDPAAQYDLCHRLYEQ
ncbi:MAG: transcriptional regulator, partial [Muribaculaceae bacterium]|nr:transcriptional regulator [Muribaculaceae bacterium]